MRLNEHSIMRRLIIGQFVIPGLTRDPVPLWIPAFAGMTVSAATNVGVYRFPTRRSLCRKLR